MECQRWALSGRTHLRHSRALRPQPFHFTPQLVGTRLGVHRHVGPAQAGTLFHRAQHAHAMRQAQRQAADGGGCGGGQQLAPNGVAAFAVKQFTHGQVAFGGGHDIGVPARGHTRGFTAQGHAGNADAHFQADEVPALVKREIAACWVGVCVVFLEAVFDVLGFAAIFVILIAWFNTAEASPGLARGGLPLYALLSTLAIYVATRAGMFSRIFANPALRWAGLLSYGLYLYHWPVFLLLSQDRTGLSLGPLFVVRMIVTIAIALASYFLLEMPVRRGTLFSTTRSAGTAALVGISAVVVCAFAITLHTPVSTVPYANMRVDQIESRLEQLVPQNPVDSNSPPPARLWIIGDSGAMDVSPALAAAAEATGASSIVFGATISGSGLWTRPMT